MSELSEDKTKRKIIERLLAYPWVYQVTVFFEDYDHSQELPQVMPEIRTKLRRAFPNDPIFSRTALKYHSATKERIAYETFYCLRRIPEVKKCLRSWMKGGEVRSRPISSEKRLSSARSIRKERPHNLKGYFGKSKVNRIRLLNEAKLPAPDPRLYEAFLEGVTHPEF